MRPDGRRVQESRIPGSRPILSRTLERFRESLSQHTYLIRCQVVSVSRNPTKPAKKMGSWPWVEPDEHSPVGYRHRTQSVMPAARTRVVQPSHSPAHRPGERMLPVSVRSTGSEG